MKKLLPLIILLFLFAAGELSAQVTDEYKENLETMLRITNVDAVFLEGIKHVTASQKRKHPDVPEEFWQEFEAEYQEASWPFFLNEMASVYISYYTLSDLEEIIKFYQSPIGRKMTEHHNSISQKLMARGVEFGRILRQELKQKLQQYGYRGNE